MSAFMNERAMFTQLAAYAVNSCNPRNGGLRELERVTFSGEEHPSLTAEGLANWIATILAEQNRRSVNYRYQELHTEPPILLTRQEMAQGGLIPDMAVFMALRCYEYQSCETPDWTTTTAERLCRWIKDRAITRLPGYSEGNYGPPLKARIAA